MKIHARAKENAASRGKIVAMPLPPKSKSESKSKQRAVRGFPASAQLVIGIAYIASCLLYGRIAGRHLPFAWQTFAGMASFYLLFAQLRLVDNLDDLEQDRHDKHGKHDNGGAPHGGLQLATARMRIVVALWLCAAALVILNAGQPPSLIAVAAATALTYAAPFGFKRHFPTQLAFGSLLYEGAPFMFFLCIYIFWRDGTGVSLPPLAILCVAVLFWAGYEFWKFSRKIHADAMQPYFLLPAQSRLVLNLLLLLALSATLILAGIVEFSLTYMIYASLLPVAFLIWLNAAWPGTTEARVRARRQRPLWSGLTFVTALAFGLLAELLSAELLSAELMSSELLRGLLYVSIPR